MRNISPRKWCETRMKINYNECLTFHVPICNFASIKCILEKNLLTTSYFISMPFSSSHRTEKNECIRVNVRERERERNKKIYKEFLPSKQSLVWAMGVHWNAIKIYCEIVLKNFEWLHMEVVSREGKKWMRWNFLWENKRDEKELFNCF